jgi:pimeloyl-ACP methyl ester carboxylesterase
MTQHKGLLAGVGVLSVTAVAVIVGAAPARGAPPVPEARWHTCPQYSDDAIRSVGVPDDRIADFRGLMARTDCGTVRVPLDYAKPDGQWITIAVTRLKATDRAHRAGSIALNPGGPGGSGYLMPITLALSSSAVAGLTDRYDLIGFDPRGVGYSSKVDCPRDDDGPRPEPPAGPLTEQTARAIYDTQVKHNEACARSNPRFLTQLTTANVARDLNQVRQALRLPTISYFGASWGTLLGAVYRSMFPTTVSRMWLDSVVGPTANRLDVRATDTTRATEQSVARWAAWAAARDTTYHLGGTADQVVRLVRQLKAKLDANPITFSDVPMPIDGNFIAWLAASPSPAWSLSTQALAEMRTAKSGEPAPPTVAPIITPPSGPPPGPPPADAPEGMNPVANVAILCNDDTSPHDFASFWKSYQQRRRDFPITTSLDWNTQPCAGWPTPSRPFQLRAVRGSLELSGHRYESVTPYPWAAQLRSAIGGVVFTVEDDIHGSVPFVPACAEHLAGYLATGRADGGGCPGFTGAEATAAPSLINDRGVPTGAHWSWH